jgi:hypothetical protein
MEEQCEPAHAVLDVTAITALDLTKWRTTATRAKNQTVPACHCFGGTEVLGWGHSISASFACSADFEGVSLFV